MKIDLHLHTVNGSACAYMEPDALVQKAKAVGMDGVCITDHDYVWAPNAVERLRDKHGFLVIGGAEVGTEYGHVLVFGLHETVRDVFYANDLRKMVDEAGGVMVLAHPFRGEPALVRAYFDASSNGKTEEFVDTLEAVCLRPVFQLMDALETYNGASSFNEVELATVVAERLNLKGTGGSDAHAVIGVGACYTVFEEPVHDEQDLIGQIKAGRFHGVDDRRAAPMSQPE
ncbi:MAG: PHP domain-containing protein [Candidatus Hydrogenedentes bacterium]|nr:PHP domain-containing protein [Candidatus Hydrogenedentota bacterium]